MDNRYKNRIEQLREKMTAAGMDLYYIPMDDCHNSEYVGDHFKAIAYVSGFTGSAAKIVITREEAFLWTDGRYYLQAEKELQGSGITLMKMGMEGVPTVEDFLNGRMCRGEVLGFEGRVVPAAFAQKLGGRIDYSRALVQEIWTDRPRQIFSKIKNFANFSGESASSKLARLRKALEETTERPYIHIINSLDDIAWLFNIRADDVAYNPVAYAYAAITKEQAFLYIGEGAADDEIDAYLASVPVERRSYTDLQQDILATIRQDLPEEHPVILLDTGRISYDMYQAFCDNGYDVCPVENPTQMMKAVKNQTEIENTKNAQIKDGVAMVRFMKWIKETAGTKNLTECDISDQVLQFRSEQEGFLQPSFETIAGYGPNAAIIHYEPVRGTDAQVEAKGMLLLDSGGHYEQGTTDTTRTMILGETTEEEKKCFTLVAASMLRLLNFDERKAQKEGTAFNGLQCDLVARELLASHGYHYNHGTGHGIGYVLNVHEDPPVISGSRAREAAGKPFIPGMISSDEPGVYIEGKFGIRTENDMLVVKKEDAEGCYLAFENLTFVPIDLDGISTAYLEDADKELLNRYHEEVYRTLAPHLKDDEKDWLKHYTRPVE